MRRRSARSRRMLGIGVAGTAVTGVCCFTPLLVVTLGAFGASAAVGWLDYMLLPAMAGFMALTGYALWRRRQTA